jgi:hypothetical protein
MFLLIKLEITYIFQEQEVRSVRKGIIGVEVSGMTCDSSVIIS